MGSLKRASLLAGAIGLVLPLLSAPTLSAAQTGQNSPGGAPVTLGKPGQDFGPLAAQAGNRGAAVFKNVCATCHEHGIAHAPAVTILQLMTPASIYRVLTTGPMQVQASDLSDADKKAVAQFLAGKNIASDSGLAPPACKGSAAVFDNREPPVFPGWGVTLTNTRDIPATTGGIDVGNVGRLKLKWALGFAGATRVRSHPALAGGAIYIGSESGTVYALDRRAGCLRWEFHASAEVRTGIVVAPWNAGDKSARPLLYFGDIVGNVYAVDAETGAQAWRDRVDPHPSTTITGSPVLYGNRLYVPVSSLEEAIADPRYECCTFRGSIVAYDALTGKRAWQSYMMAKPAPQGVNSSGAGRFGPSGAPIWNTPAIDEKRGVLYFGTGDNYSSPTNEISDAIVALDLKTGKFKWVYQATARDAWNGACGLAVSTLCPKEDGPDFDFGAAAILATSSDGKQFVVAGQKSGWVYALAPDTGKLIWKTKVGRGGIKAGVYFGMAVQGDKVFVPISDPPDNRSYPEPAKPGLYAIDLRSGKFLWKAPNQESTCQGRGPNCSLGIAAAASVTDGLVLTGASDGWLRIYDANTGHVLWRFDTTKRVKTVGGGEAAGGSMGGGTSPIAYHGALIVESGYSFAGAMPGNVLLVFDTK
jgi:polyvinyl alcohol dehydrogenase (cytochrome)